MRTSANTVLSIFSRAASDNFIPHYLRIRRKRGRDRKRGEESVGARGDLPTRKLLCMEFSYLEGLEVKLRKERERERVIREREFYREIVR
jgi:hypothetical protein